MDIPLRGELWDNDSTDILRWWGWRDITAPMDVAQALEQADGEEVTLLINSPGGSMAVGNEIRSMLRRYPGRTRALFQGYGASAATLAAAGCREIQSEPGALLCYHNPIGEPVSYTHLMSPHAAEKRAVYDRLLCFRQARGLGCLRELVGGDLTESMLRSALLGEKLTIGDWRLIDQALARAEG